MADVAAHLQQSGLQSLGNQKVECTRSAPGMEPRVAGRRRRDHSSRARWRDLHRKRQHRYKRWMARRAICCGNTFGRCRREIAERRESVMRGMAIYQEKLYAPTADGHVIALDVKTGKARLGPPGGRTRNRSVLALQSRFPAGWRSDCREGQGDHRREPRHHKSERRLLYCGSGRADR